MTGTLSVFALQSYAADAADPETPCDPQFMQAMSARAWLEAQREITQNQNLISKPDSVLEYSCFIGFLNRAASNFTIGGLGRQFSETRAWDTDGFSETSTDQALTNVVASALKTYLDGNFPKPQKYLGGRLDIEPDRANVGTVNGDTDYNCAEMARVWEAARCLNFQDGDHAEKDGFRDFFWYRDNDPRDLPGDPIKSCKALNTGLPDVYDTNIKEAFNNKQTNFVLPAADDKNPDGTPYEADDVKSYFDLILPGACGNGGNPIPTGVTIRRGGNAGQADGVCPNPGCSLVGGRCE